MSELPPKPRAKTRLELLRDQAVQSALREFGGVPVEDLKAHGYALIVSTFYITCFLFCFAFLTYLNVSSLLSTRFLSFATTNENQICTEIPNTITGSYEASFDGVWSTNVSFLQNRSIFALEFTGTSITPAQYTQTMLKFKDSLSKLGTTAASRSVVWNYLAFSTFSFEDKDFHMRFYSNVDPGIAFKPQIQVWNVMISSRSGICNSAEVYAKKYIYAFYDSAAMELNINIPFDVHEQSINYYSVLGKNVTRIYPKDSCSNWITKVKDGNSGIAHDLANGRDGQLKVKFDVRTTAVAVALNLGIISTDILLRIDSRALAYNKLIAYVDPWFSPAMEPVYCLDKVAWKLTKRQIDGPEVCFIMKDLAYFFYPMANQLYNSPTLTTCGGNPLKLACKCPYNANTPGCQSADIYFGYFYDRRNETEGKFYGLSNAEHGTPPVELALRIQDVIINNPVNGDQDAMEYLSNIFGYSSNLFNSYGDRNTPIPISEKCVGYSRNKDGTVKDNPWSEGKSFNGLLQSAWDEVCPQRTCGAAIFRYKSDDFLDTILLPMNRYAMELSSLANASYYDSGLKTRRPTRACIDAMSQSEAMLKLAETPPVALTQAFHTCKYSLQSALLQGVGTAAASANLYTTVAMGLIGFFFVRWMNSKLPEPLITRAGKQELKDDCIHHLITGMATEINSLRAQLQLQDKSKGPSVLAEASGDGNQEKDDLNWRQTMAYMHKLEHLYPPIETEEEKPQGITVATTQEKVDIDLRPARPKQEIFESPASVSAQSQKRPSTKSPKVGQKRMSKSRPSPSFSLNDNDNSDADSASDASAFGLDDIYGEKEEEEEEMFSSGSGSRRDLAEAVALAVAKSLSANEQQKRVVALPQRSCDVPFLSLFLPASGEPVETVTSPRSPLSRSQRSTGRSSSKMSNSPNRENL